MNDNWTILTDAVPEPPDWEINWEKIMRTPLSSYFVKMSETLQNPYWHGEGDVLTHIKMVCGQLAQDEEYRRLEREKQEILFVAALMHDIGKIPCTRLEDGEWKSPNHTIVGSKMAREILWRDFAIAGTKEEQEIRECVCNLIRFHSVPVHITEQTNPVLRLYQIAAQGELIRNFSLHLLSILVRADIMGRVCDTMTDSLELMELCFSLAEDEDILYNPGCFQSEAVKQAFLSGKNVWKEQDIFDDTWGEVILMSGLPGTGKDTWIKANYGDLPVISLDDIRGEMRISPTDNQGAVIQEARERAKRFLRRRQPFVWNATNLSPMVRRKQLSLFEDYHARTKVIFLETDWGTNLSRNESRNDAVPAHKIENMMKNLEPPERVEARTVEWHCI